MDLIRGVAVLGILAINVIGFAGPSPATYALDIMQPATPSDRAVFALNLLVFDGKMRALFTLLFGASMALFLEQREEARGEGEAQQLRRLAWLMVFGQLHYFLFWWGDILFLYGACGLLLLALSPLSPRAMTLTALACFALWHGWDALASWPGIEAEEAFRQGRATAGQAAEYRRQIDWIADQTERENALYRSGYLAILRYKLAESPFWLFAMLRQNLGETLPLMMIGMALGRSGFFRGAWPRRRLWAFAIGTTAAGLAASVPVLAWLAERGFPPIANGAMLGGLLAPTQMLIALGYAALLVLAVPALVRTRPGRRLVAAGRMALSNYVGTTVVMTAIFYGWGLGLFGRFGNLELWAFVLLGWALMLAWSEPWLRRFRQGPLEWAWRSLTLARFVAMR
ncbi:hypothetical protein B2G71_03375 [Novosphingobium sp. PC22D]|nr:hypothetical protein B2G71_03375 [Novosphingobium sp. PC22D]